MAQIQTKDPDEMMECHKHCKLNFHTYHCQQGKEERKELRKIRTWMDTWREMCA